MIAGLEDITDGDLSIGDRVVNDVAAEGPRHRHGVPELRPLPAHDGVRQPGVRPQAAQDRQEGDRAARQGGGRDILASTTAPRPQAQASSPAASASASRSAAPSCASPRSSSSTSRSPTSTPSCACRCAPRSRASTSASRRRSIYVTHDQVEAMTMGQRIAVMTPAKLQQVGPPQELYDRPVNKFVAGFIGSPSMNFVSMSARGRRGGGDPQVPGLEIPLRRSLPRGSRGDDGSRLRRGRPPEHCSTWSPHGRGRPRPSTHGGRRGVPRQRGAALTSRSPARTSSRRLLRAGRVRPGDIVTLHSRSTRCTCSTPRRSSRCGARSSPDPRAPRRPPPDQPGTSRAARPGSPASGTPIMRP